MNEQNKNYIPHQKVETGDMTKPEIVSALYNYAIKAMQATEEVEADNNQSIEDQVGAIGLSPETVDVFVRNNTPDGQFHWNGSKVVGQGQLLGNVDIPVNLEGSATRDIRSVEYDNRYGDGATQQAIDDFQADKQD